MDIANIKKILDNGGERADLQEADLQGADLRRADFWGADFRGANLRGANLWGADLWGADFRGANLWEADLQEADLRRANLQRADLRRANLQRTNLRGANLWEANLQEADLLGTCLPDFQCIPEEGSFISWKKGEVAGNKTIIKLEIPENALRTSNLINRKCRASEAIVKNCFLIQSNGSEIGEKIEYSNNNTYQKIVKYVVGKKIKENGYDGDIRIDCAPGIHFFPTLKEALEW